MKDKKQDVNSLQELAKTADSYRAFFANLANELSKVLADIKAPDEEENTWEMKCSYKYDRYWFIYSDSDVDSATWFGGETDKGRFKNGNVFPTKEAAELEAKRRNLLTQFRAFRDECNDRWKPDWTKDDGKYYLYYSHVVNKIMCDRAGFYSALSNFGYFKTREDAERAIDLFGDEIQELFVEGE